MIKSLDKIIVLYIYLVFSIVIVPLTNEKYQYIPMLAVMYISPLLLLSKLRQLKLQDFLMIGIGVMMLVSLFRHPVAFRWSSYLYSCMFIMTYIYFTKALCNANIDKRRLLNLFSFIIKAYAIVLVIQHVCVVCGLPVVNASYGGAEISGYSGFKQGALSIEPSNTGPILTIIMYVYIKMWGALVGREISLSDLLKNKKGLILSYFYVCIGSISVTCILSLLVFLLYFFKMKQILIAIIGAGGLIILLSVVIPDVYDRISTLIIVLLSFDPYQIYEIDPSSSARIAPYLFYFMEFNFFDPNLWLGYGMDYGGLHVFGTLEGHFVEDNAGMGGLINLMYDYGLIVTILFFIFIIKLCGLKSFSFLIYLILFTPTPFNNYMLWLFFFMVYTLNYYSQNTNKYSLQSKCTE